MLNLFIRNSSSEEEEMTVSIEIATGGSVVAVAVIDGLRVAPSEESRLEVPLSLPRGDYEVRVHVLARASREREFCFRLSGDDSQRIS